MNRTSLIVMSTAVVAALVGFGIGWVANGYSTSGQTVQQQIAEILRENVHNGMSVDDIANLVGQDLFVRNYEIPESVREHYFRMFRDRGSAVQPDDNFCAIRLGNGFYTLHFRNGKLINCEPEDDFADPEKMIAGIAA